MDGFVVLSTYVFIFVGAPVLAYILAVLVSRHFESRKFTVEITSWTLLYPLFLIITVASQSIIWTYFQDLAHNYPFNFDLLSTFSSAFRAVFLDGLNGISALFGAIWAVGLLVFMSEKEKRNNKARTSVPHL